jgi:hypothetical protein
VRFEIVSQVEIIAAGAGVRDIERLRKLYGDGRWRKLKRGCNRRLPSGRLRRAEIHWCEVHGIG